MDDMFCASCNGAIEPHHAWRGSTGTFYCSAFCADSEYDDHLSSIETAPRDDADSREAA
jgi:hypothetical protein